MSDDDYYRRTYGVVKRLRQTGGGDLDELVLYCILYIGQTMPRCKQGQLFIQYQYNINMKLLLQQLVHKASKGQETSAANKKQGKSN